MREVAQHTPLTMEQIKATLRDAYLDVFGEPIGKVEPYLLAMLALEHGRGSGLWSHNWGNVISLSDSDPHFFLGDNPRPFLSLPNHSAGARHFLDTLNSRTNKRILTAARRDDFNAFWKGITTPHPETRMMYCDTCENTRDTYQKLVREFKRGGRIKLPKHQRRVRKSGGDGVSTLLSMSLIVGGAYLLRSKFRKLLKGN